MKDNIVRDNHQIYCSKLNHASNYVIWTSVKRDLTFLVDDDDDEENSNGHKNVTPTCKRLSPLKEVSVCIATMLFSGSGYSFSLLVVFF